MKDIIALCAVAAILIFGCNRAPKGDQAVITEEKETSALSGTTYNVDTANSFIEFTGHGVGKNHVGKFKLSDGTVSVQENKITGGKFTIDVTSMELDEKDKKFDEKLRPHLLSGDFLDAAKFGKATFEVTEVSPYENNGQDTSIIAGANYLISGNLTIKDVTKNIMFPANVNLDNDKITAKGNFDIDRTEWQINYGNDKTLGDKFISEKVNIKMDLLGNKADL